MRYKLYLEQDNSDNVITNQQGKVLLDGKEQIWLWVDLKDNHLYNEHGENLGALQYASADLNFFLKEFNDSAVGTLAEHFQFRKDLVSHMATRHVAVDQHRFITADFNRLKEYDPKTFSIMAALLYEAILDKTGYRLIYLDAPDLPFHRRDIFGAYREIHEVDATPT